MQLIFTRPFSRERAVAVSITWHRLLFFVRHFCRGRRDKASARIWTGSLNASQLIQIIIMRTLCNECNWIDIRGVSLFRCVSLYKISQLNATFHLYGIEIALFGYRSSDRRKCEKNKVDKNGNISFASSIIRFICSQFVFGASVLPATRHHSLKRHYAWNNANAQANATSKNGVRTAMHS